MKKIIIGNWKLNLDHLEAIQLLQKINYSLPESIEDNIEIEPAEGKAEDPTIKKSKMFHGSLKNLCL